MLALFFLLAAAFGATYTTSVTINLDKDTPPVGYSETFTQRFVAPAPGLGPALYTSDWSYMTCGVSLDANNQPVAYLEFASDRASWPSTWPTVKCSGVSSAGDTYEISVTINDCSTTICEVIWPAAMAACPTGTSTLSMQTPGNGLANAVCTLPAPPTGKIYARPPEGFLHPDYGRVWYARKALGASADPANDPPQMGALCRYHAFESGTKILELLVEGQSADVNVYCPVRWYTTSTRVYSWAASADNIKFQVDTQL